MSDHEPLDRSAANFDWGIMGMFLVWFNNSMLSGLTLTGKTLFLDKAGFIMRYKVVIPVLRCVWFG